MIFLFRLTFLQELLISKKFKLTILDEYNELNADTKVASDIMVVFGTGVLNAMLKLRLTT